MGFDVASLKALSNDASATHYSTFETLTVVLWAVFVAIVDQVFLAAMDLATRAADGYPVSYNGIDVSYCAGPRECKRTLATFMRGGMAHVDGP